MKHIIKTTYTKNEDFEYVCDYPVFPHAQSYNIGNNSFLIFAQCARKSHVHNYSDIL